MFNDRPNVPSIPIFSVNQNREFNPDGVPIQPPSSKFPLHEIIPTEYDSMFRKRLVRGFVHDEAAAMLGGVSGNAGLFGTSEDVYKLFQMYSNGGNYNGNQILKEETVWGFTSHQYCTNDNRRGLGFDKPLLEYDVDRSYVAEDASPYSFGHSGFTGTYAWADPEEEIVYVFMANRTYPKAENNVLLKKNIRTAIQRLIYEAIDN